jgi:hypothetical protein
MKRDFNWRKHQEEKHWKKRIFRQRHSRFYGFYTRNGTRIQDPSWVEYINNPDYYFIRKTSSTKVHSRYKDKYSPNKSKFGHDTKPQRGKSFSYGKRELDKLLTRKILSEFNI